MNLMCIDDSYAFGGKHPILKFGETYFADGEMKNTAGEDCWILPGMPVTTDAKTWMRNSLPLYRKSRFIPIDAQPEEVIEELEEATA